MLDCTNYGTAAALACRAAWPDQST
jgi:hypothetical protein